MTLSQLLPVLTLSTSLITGLVIFCLPELRQSLRSVLNLTAAVAKVLLVGWMIWGVWQEQLFETRFPIVAGIDFVLRADALAMLFAGLSAVLWLFTTIYAIGYLEGSPNRSRFFGFFSVCVASTMGIALAGNLFTFLIFYELLTLSTYPLVVHRGTREALAAGRSYLAYTLTGGAVLLVGTVWLYSLAGDVMFREGGQLWRIADLPAQQLAMIFALLIGGLAVKAAMFPVHGWLPRAMVAPAPVSALLHAVAVVKAGVFGMVRVIYDVYGISFSAELNLLTPLLLLAAFTIIYGSLRALAQTDLKRRLAFSTVSQVSYVALGISLFGPLGTIGGLVHLLHQGLMKITLFFCAGSYAETLGVHHIDELKGAGRRMPWTSLAFTVGAFGMIGVPPLAGFVSKWYLGSGALAAGLDWVVAVLVLSTLLNAAYFLPLLYRIWFQSQREDWPEEQPLLGGQRRETTWWLLMPLVATALMSLLAGLLASVPFSPLFWAELITEREYLP